MSEEISRETNEKEIPEQIPRRILEKIPELISAGTSKGKLGEINESIPNGIPEKHARNTKTNPDIKPRKNPGEIAGAVSAIICDRSRR